MRLGCVGVRLCLPLLALLAIGPGCGPDEEVIRVRLNDRREAALPGAGDIPPPLRIAVAPILSPSRSLLRYRQLVLHLGQRLGRTGELVVKDTYAEVNHLLRERMIHAAFVCTYPYVEGHRSFGMELLAAPLPDGEPKVEAYLIVRKGSPYRSLADLRGRTFAFTDPLSNTGLLLPTYRILRMGETPDSFFGETIFTHSHSSSIRSVAEGQMDAASVLGLAFDFERDAHPEVTRRTEVIERWPSGGLPPVVVHPSLDPELKAGLRAELLGLADSAAGRRILARLRLRGFVVPEDSDYEGVRKMAAVLDESWRGRRGR